MSFKELQLIEPLLRALETEGYERPTPIQEQAIPPLIAGRDLLGCAQTGTGKTAAFALPILQTLQHLKISQQQQGGKKAIKTLVLTPTRELAIQIGDSFTAYGRHCQVRNLVIFGGVSQHAQTQALQRGTDVLVATPGRLLDLMQQGFISLQDISIFVLDEADRMLDMGFIHDVKKVIAKLPAKRQTLLFSATMPGEIAHLADSILTNPIKVAVTPVSSTAEKVSQAVYFVEKNNKRHLLAHLLGDKNIKSALVFTRTKHGANRVASDLAKVHIKAQAIHGNKSQNARQAALSGFKAGQLRVLVATDIAARGIDIDDLTHVINFDLPNIPETYVHRIGRTGRAGASGIALSFCDSEELPYLKDIQKLTGLLVPVIKEHPYAADLVAPELSSTPQRKQGQGQAQRPQQNSRKTPIAAPKATEAPSRQPRQEKTQQETARPQQTPSGNPGGGQVNQRQNARRKNRRNRQEQPQQPQQQRRQENTPAAKPSGASSFPDRRNRFASILEAAKLEKQESVRKPKPAFKDRQKEGAKEEKSGNGGFGQRRRWKNSDRAKKSTGV